MQDKVLKKFRLKCSLTETKTGKSLGIRDVIITGYCGNDAVYSYKNQLKKEGLYSLGESYSYFEIGPVENI